MELYEYLIGGKKTGRIEDLKDVIPDSKPFRDLKTGDSFFMSEFKPDGTCTYADEIKITSIHKESDGCIFRGFTKKGEKRTRPVWTEDLDKPFYVDAGFGRTYYEVYSTFKMDDKPFFELVKKEIKN